MNLLKKDKIKAIQKTISLFKLLKAEDIQEIFIADLKDLSKYKLQITKRNILDREMIISNQEGVKDIYIRTEISTPLLEEIIRIILVFFSFERGDITEKFKKLLTKMKNG